MSRVIIIGGLIGFALWVLFNALGITWLGYLLATIIVGSVGWSLKDQSITSIHYVMDAIGLVCCVGVWLLLIYSYEIEWAKALFLSSLLLLIGGLINQISINLPDKL